MEIGLTPRPEFSEGSDASEGPDGSIRPPVEPSEPLLHRGIALPYGVRENGSDLLNEVREWLRRHIVTPDPGDLDILTVWAAHTHLVLDLYSTPRLQIDSAIPGSGKTTVLEHLERLCFKPVMAASISSPALLARLVGNEPRTLLLDEVDRTLNPKKEGVGELIALINSGYKVGGSRPTLMPVKGGGWTPEELSTFAPVAMAGNQPMLPDDTKTRIIRVLLLPDTNGVAEESDWEVKDHPAAMLGARLARWAAQSLEAVRERPAMPPGVMGRYREKWQPLARVAQAAGGDWLARIMRLAAADVDQGRRDKEDGLTASSPHILALQHIVAVWPEGKDFLRSEDVAKTLVSQYPEVWGSASTYGKDLTVQRLGRLMVNAFNIRVAPEDRADKNSHRGYRRIQFDAALDALSGGSPDRRIEPSGLPEPSEPSEPADSGVTVRDTSTPDPVVSVKADGPACPVCGGPNTAERDLMGYECLDCHYGVNQ